MLRKIEGLNPQKQQEEQRLLGLHRQQQHTLDLYIGVTSELEGRVWEHRTGAKPGSFSERYHCGHLVYFEHYRNVRDALAREKQLKGWRREKKNALIATLNPHWDDLAADWE